MNQTPHDLAQISASINDALRVYSDKDWNYSRIALEVRKLESLSGPYALWIESVDVRTKEGRVAFKACEEEVAWGSRHSNELGILELISLRLNKALLESTTDDIWDYRRPIIRLVKKEEITDKGLTDAFWYIV